MMLIFVTVWFVTVLMKESIATTAPRSFLCEIEHLGMKDSFVESRKILVEPSFGRSHIPSLMHTAQQR